MGGGGFPWKKGDEHFEETIIFRFHVMGQIITASAEVTLNGGLVGASHQNHLVFRGVSAFDSELIQKKERNIRPRRSWAVWRSLQGCHLSKRNRLFRSGMWMVRSHAWDVGWTNINQESIRNILREFSYPCENKIASEIGRKTGFWKAFELGSFPGQFKKYSWSQICLGKYVMSHELQSNHRWRYSYILLCLKFVHVCSRSLIRMSTLP